ncbi:hypothetical protein [Burkholderia vietnamiensis]|uniref:hypothetical protein n=1 Tax=Burkholderia vietnamiensis TaxID=60552 RepID=UPI000D88D16D|nr:hypothetical protein [Burkholderia vietnamiensis]GBH26077.1 hypothetical protein BvRS1_31260 [Burkholderia vietnamiensis]
MSRVSPRSASIVALLIILNVGEFSLEKERKYSAYRMNRATLRALAARNNLTQPFLCELTSELQNRGWYLVDTDDHFAVVHVSRISEWARLTSKRVSDYLDWSEEQLEERISAIFPEESSSDDDL